MATLEQIEQTLRQLTGAVNAQIEAVKKIEKRLDNLERPVIPTTTAKTLVSPKNEQELKEISKLPDSVKELQIFDGNPTQYISWVHNVESILHDYDILRNKPIYRAILQHIRQKIRGHADSALVSYNIFNEEWAVIKKCLSLHYADKRDLRTLEHQLSNISQRHMTIDEFYATVNHQFSLIVNKIKTEDYSTETINVLVETYRNRALDVFIRGLNGDLARILIIQKPTTLPEAYASCLEIQNLNFRNQAIHKKNINNMITAPINQIPYINSANHQKIENTIPIQRRNIMYNMQHQNHRIPYMNQNQGNLPPPRPNNPKPPTPMDIDPSIQTRQVNYINRPINHDNPTTKREHSNSNEPRKYQRINHLETRLEEEYYNQLVDENTEDEISNDDQWTEENSEVNFMMEASLAYHT